MNVSTPTAIQHPLLKAAHERAVTLPANTVQVWPGGAKFTTITDAINSIQSATPEEQYQVIIGPGTYNELVWLKDNVFISGAGQDLTTITWQLSGAACGALATTGNCGAGMLTVNAWAGEANGFACALYGGIDGTFQGEGLTLLASDAAQQNTVVAAVSNLAGANTCTIELANCVISAKSTAGGSTTFGVQMMGGGCSANIEFSTITGGNPTGIGVITTQTATAVISGSTVTGAQYSLSNDDQQSPITASGCTLNGPVTPGVIVNP